MFHRSTDLPSSRTYRTQWRRRQVRPATAESGSPRTSASRVRRVLAAGLAVALGAATLLGLATPAQASPGVTASVVQDSSWASGWCGAVVVRNATAASVQLRGISVNLPAEATVSGVWNAQANLVGSRLTLTTPSWATAPAGGTYRDTGFCLDGGPTPPTAPAVEIVGEPTTPSPELSPTPAPSPTPTPTPTPVTEPNLAPPPVLPPDGDFPYATPLRTNGNSIVDSQGREIILQGVNWFGFETANHAPHGLWARDYKQMLAQIKAQGFNTIRLPFSLEALDSTSTTGIDYGAGRNAALRDKTPQQVMDEIIDEAARNGLMILLDNHSLSDDSHTYGLWYGLDGYTEEDWINAWLGLAARYADRPNVIGADLKNEPHGPATWGDGGATDWRRAAESAGSAVLSQAPHWLIIVEGIEGPVSAGQSLDRHWWGGNLEGVRQHPVRLPIPDRVVYSPHEYGPGVFNQPWFSSPQMAEVLADRWDKGFGYIHDSQTAPILVGEFGGRQTQLDSTEGRWMRQFADYLGTKGMSWTFWSWNPNSGDTGGVLKDDWTSIDAEKMALLDSLIKREPIAYAEVPPGPPTPSPTPEPDPTPQPTPAPIPSTPPVGEQPTDALVATFSADSDWATGYCRTSKIKNNSARAVPSWQLVFSLPTDTTVGSSWNGSVRRSGDTVTVTPPVWGARIEPGQEVSVFGFCANGTTHPSMVRAEVR